MEKDIFIALGSNIGDRELNLLRAVAEVGKLPDSRITSLSPFYDTEPVGISSAENFMNAVLKLESSLTPHELLKELMRIESAVFNRKRTGNVDSRRMDLDLLFYGSAVTHAAPELILPHPRAHLRKFVLQPMADIAPDFLHPLSGRTVAELLAEVDDSSVVTRV